MLNLNVRFTEEPAFLVMSALPDGRYDVWLRHGIGSETKSDENGEACVEYYAEREAYARLDEPFTLAPGDPDYDNAFERVAAWEPDKPGEAPDEMKVLRDKVDKLTSSNEMLTECILEMSAILYA